MKKIIYILCFGFYLLIVEDVSAEMKYVVKKGDTLWKIAGKYQVDLNLLIKSNIHIENPNLIYPREIVNIPSQSIESNDKKMMNPTERKLLVLINNHRTKEGLNQLTVDNSLVNAARLKSIDMQKKGYVSHNSPTYGKPNLMLKELNISFQTVKESIGAGHTTSEEIISSWLSSSVNRANIMDEQATHIGIGYAEGGVYGYYWTILIIEK